MIQTFRFVLSAIALIASLLFIYWVPFSFLSINGDNRFLPGIISLMIAAAIAVYVWKKTTAIPDHLISSIVLGGVILGSIGFCAGFFGPMILRPDANQGPLLGIFFTGPLGFILGLIGGAVYWLINRKKRTPKTSV